MRWWHRWRADVEFRCEGGLCERFLSLLKQEGVALWDVRLGDGCVTAVCRASEYRKVRLPARRTGTRVHVIRRLGAGFRLWAIGRRPGLIAGAISAVAVYVVLASCIWIIDIQTEDPRIRAAVERELASCGIARGVPASEADLAAVRMRVIAGVEELHQMSVYLEGCAARVDIRWQEEGAPRPDSTPSNVIASCDGQILSMRVTHGQAMVKAGDAVVAGDLLVCGAVETEHGVLLSRASATVTARTTRCFEAAASRTETVETDGRVYIQPSVRLFWWSVPCYSPSTFTERFSERQERSDWRWLDTPMPIGVEQTVYTERCQRTVSLSDEQVKAVARARLAAQAAAVLGTASVEESTLEERWEGDRYILRGQYTCIEDIAVQTPLLSDFE